MTDSEHRGGPTAVVAGRTIGRVEFDLREAEKMFVNRPSGYVSPSMVRETLAAAARFGERHPTGWSYVVITPVFVIPNPLNILHLRSIPGLPNLAQYAIVASNPLLRALSHALKLVSHPDAVVRSIEDLPPR